MHTARPTTRFTARLLARIGRRPAPDRPGRPGLRRPRPLGPTAALPPGGAGHADLAAMGGTTTALLVGLACPGAPPPAWREGVAAGLAAECEPLGAAVVGGDMVTAAADSSPRSASSTPVETFSGPMGSITWILVCSRILGSEKTSVFSSEPNSTTQQTRATSGFPRDVSTPPISSINGVQMAAIAALFSV